MIAAQEALDAAVAELERGHDAELPEQEIGRLEAAVADARVSVDRAQRAYNSSEKRLAALDLAEKDKIKEAAREKLAAALAKRKSAALEIDRLAGLIADQVKVINGTIGDINLAHAAGVAASGPSAWMSRVVEFSLQKAGALDSIWVDGRDDQPGARELIARDEATITSPVHASGPLPDTEAKWTR